MRVLETPSFRKDIKRLHANQKQDLDGAVRVILADPMSGELKLGDRHDDRIEVVEGLKQGQKVAITDVDNLADGMKVNVKELD